MRPDLAIEELEPSEGVESLVDRIVGALRMIRLTKAGLNERAIQSAIAAKLSEDGFRIRVEHKFAPRCRADIWIDGLVLEVKKHRPVTADVLAQVSKYAKQDCVRGVIVVLEKSVVVPASISGKPVRVFSLNACWGVAV